MRAGSPSGPIRVVLLGFGVGGAVFHAPLIATTPGLRLAAVVTRDQGRRALAAAHHPDAALLAEPEQVWREADAFDLAVVATPNKTHAPLALAALRAGLPVVVDKPIATTLADARELAAEAADRGLALVPYQNRRWDGDFRTLRALLAQGALGQVSRFESRFERWRPTPGGGSGDAWKSDPTPGAGGGILYDLGSHLIDQALVLFGRPLTVYAELDRRRPGVRVEDDAFVALSHPGGVRSHLWMSAVAADPGPRLRVLGDRAGYVKHGMDPQEAALRAGRTPGAAGWGGEPPESWGRLGAGGRFEPTPTLPGCYPEFYRGVTATLRAGAPPPVEPADAVAVVEVVEAAQRSAAERAVVRLPS